MDYIKVSVLKFHSHGDVRGYKASKNDKKDSFSWNKCFSFVYTLNHYGVIVIILHTSKELDWGIFVKNSVFILNTSEVAASI